MRFRVVAELLAILCCACVPGFHKTSANSDASRAESCPARSEVAETNVDAAIDVRDLDDHVDAVDAGVPARPDSGPGWDGPEDTPPPLPCSPTPIPFNAGEVAACENGDGNGCSSFLSCALTPEGTLRMHYDIDRAAPDRQWGICEVAANQDFADFDAAYGNNGLLEAVFCVETDALRGELNLWYGRHPLRKKLTLAAGDEILGVGCYVRYYSPEQARFPSWPETTPPSCSGGCGGVSDECAQDWRSTIEQASAAPGGQDFDLHSTHLLLAAEESVTAASGTVNLTAVRYLRGDCGCFQDSDCSSADRTICRRVVPTDCIWPSNRRPGVCGPSSIGCSGPPGPGVKCQTTIGAQVCEGTTVCIEGQYSCPMAICR
jgi:hypothetical protein